MTFVNILGGHAPENTGSQPVRFPILGGNAPERAAFGAYCGDSVPLDGLAPERVVMLRNRGWFDPHRRRLRPSGWFCSGMDGWFSRLKIGW